MMGQTDVKLVLSGLSNVTEAVSLSHATVIRGYALVITMRRNRPEDCTKFTIQLPADSLCFTSFTTLLVGVTRGCHKWRHDLTNQTIQSPK